MRANHQTYFFQSKQTLTALKSKEVEASTVDKQSTETVRIPREGNVYVFNIY